jgi:small-conductance mechanosensitive channel
VLPASLALLLASSTPTPDPSGSATPTPGPIPTPGFTEAAAKFTEARSSVTCVKGDLTVCGQVWKWFGSKGVGQTLEVLLGTPLRVVLIIVIALLIRRVLHTAINRLAERIATGKVQKGDGRLTTSRPAIATEPEPEPTTPLMATRRAARSRTLASVLRSIVTALVGSVAVLMVLQELDFSVAPLLASAGVVGVAIGFGAQSLVKDVVSGMFMIVEDQYGVGDVVDLGEAIGTVEAVGLRITRVRDVNGTVWYVRNGEILRVGNKSQGWARAVLDVNVDMDEDLDRVQDVLLEVATGLRSETTFRGMILADPEVWGVEAITEGGVVVRLVIQTLPGDKDTVARELRRRINRRFRDEGIDMWAANRTLLVHGSEEPEPPGPGAGPGRAGAAPDS